MMSENKKIKTKVVTNICSLRKSWEKGQNSRLIQYVIEGKTAEKNELYKVMLYGTITYNVLKDKLSLFENMKKMIAKKY